MKTETPLTKYQILKNHGLEHYIGLDHALQEYSDQQTKELQEQLADTKQTGLEAIKIAEDLSANLKKYESRVEQLQEQLADLQSKLTLSEAKNKLNYDSVVYLEEQLAAKDLELKLANGELTKIDKYVLEIRAELAAKENELSEVKKLAIEFYQCIEYIPSELQQGYLKLINTPK